MKLAAYTRVSTTEQVEHGQGLDIQKVAIEAWAKAQGHKVVHWFSDGGVSGTTSEREGLEQAIASIRFNGSEGLVVASLDRLARNLTVQEATLQAVWSSQGQVFTVDQGEVLPNDPDDPVRTFVRQVLGAVSELEAGLVRRRLARGRQHKAQAGGYAGGSPKYGYRAEGRELVPDPTEANVVALMVSWRAEGASYRDIANRLNAEGVPAKRGGQWHPATVREVLLGQEG